MFCYIKGYLLLVTIVSVNNFIFIHVLFYLCFSMIVFFYFNEHIESKEVELFTDSKYVIDGINSWIHGWKKNNWRTSTKKPVKNEELWRTLDELNSKLTLL